MEVIQGCLECVEKHELHTVNSCLQQLSQLIGLVATDEAVRSELASSIDAWRGMTKIIEFYADETQLEGELVRIVRGSVLLARNLVISCNERSRIFQFYQALLKCINFRRLDEMGKNLNTAIFQFLVNLTSSLTPPNVEDGENIKDLRFEYSFKYLKNVLLDIIFDVNQEITVLTYLNNLFNSSEFLYQFLNDEVSLNLMKKLLVNYQGIHQEGDLSQLEILLLSIFQKMYLHESFIKFWNFLVNDKDQLEFLHMAQIILGNKDNFDAFQLTSLLSWLIDLYDTFANDELTDVCLQKIFRIVDIMTNILRFDHSRQFFNHYEFLTKLCPLLQKLEKTHKRQTLKQAQVVNANPVPGLKSLIIELITFLVYEDTKNQNYIRESHTLEIILNNCQLDRNEPFIKERAIVCLRYLLDNNPENQDFVLKLQPEKVQVQDEGTLERMGIELSITDEGKVEMLNKNKDKIKEIK